MYEFNEARNQKVFSLSSVFPILPTTNFNFFKHDLGRDFIKELEKGIEDNNKDKIIENARGYAQLLQEHIFKEDNILYPMADEALNKNAKNGMLKRFKQVEQRLIKEKEKHMLFLKELKEKK